MADIIHTDHTPEVTITSQDHSMVKIDGEIPFAVLLEQRSAALTALGKELSIDGFRKGHIPERVLVEKVGEMAILNEMAERALSRLYPSIIRDHALDVIGYPSITITKLAPENPLGFSILVAVVPEVSLPEYKKIARAVEKGSDIVSDTDLESAITDIIRQKHAYERMQQKALAQKEAKEKGLTLPMPETSVAEESDDTESTVPPLTDEYVKTLGSFVSVDDFKTKLRVHLATEKHTEVVAKHRATITDRIIEMSTIDLPHVLIDAEINQMFGQMEQDLKRANLSIAEYLEHIKKTKEELAVEWAPAAEKRAKLQLVLNKIATEVPIIVPEERVTEEVARFLSQYPDADAGRVRLYVTTTLTNEAVLTMLEKESEPK